MANVKTSEGVKYPGCVERKLSFRDRLLIFQALNASVANGGDAKTLARLVRLQEVLDAEGVDDYFEVIDKAHAKQISDWATRFEHHVKAPDHAADPGPRPVQSEKDQVGKEASFWIKASLDSHIVTTLKTAKFAGFNAKHVMSLFTKFAIIIDE